MHGSVIMVSMGLHQLCQCLKNLTKIDHCFCHIFAKEDALHILESQLGRHVASLQKLLSQEWQLLR